MASRQRDPSSSGTPAYCRLSAQDSSFLMFERRATHMHVAALGLFEGRELLSEGRLDVPRIARYVESRLGELPHYRQKLAFVPITGHPVWVDDDHFDLEYHVRHTALPRPGGDAELKRLVGRILSQPLDRNRPLWEMWVIEGLGADRFALLTKVHHCMVDGASGVSLMSVLFRRDADVSIPPTEAWVPRPQPSPLRLALGEVVARARQAFSLPADLMAAVRQPRDALRKAEERATSVAEALRAGLQVPSASGLNRSIGPHRRVEMRIFDLDEVKLLRQRLGGTVNDVVLTLVASAMRRFLMRRGEAIDQMDYRVVIPVNMRESSGNAEAANRVSAFFLSLPLSEADPVARFEAVRAETRRLKDSRAAAGIDFFTQLVERSGSTWLTSFGVRLAARVQPYNLIVSNVPGPQFPLYVLGARLLELYPLAPLFERQGLGIAVMSYDGRLCWGLTGDRDVAPDLSAVAGDLDAALAELSEAAPPRAASA